MKSLQGVATAVFLVMIASAAWSSPGAPDPQALSFESGGRRIDADLYAPAHTPPRATLVVLHGAGGVLLDGPEMRRVARRLAAAGNAVYLVHYFDLTGDIVTRDAAMQKHFDKWLVTVRDAIHWARGRAGRDARPLGVYGYSLGAFLAVAAASDNPDVGAIAEQAGGIWNSQEQRVNEMPPVLMIHGRADQRVPFEKYAKPLLGVLHQRGGRVETRFFDGEGHSFTAPASAVVREELVKYFSRNLTAKARQSNPR